ncbi:MAG: hypothetical protein AAF636_13735 [Pseudomonadota bacterium]
MTDHASNPASSRNNLIVMGLQMTVSLLSTIMLCRYLFPDIFQVDFATAIFPIAVLHMFRFVAMTMLMPGQVDSRISQAAKNQIA